MKTEGATLIEKTAALTKFQIIKYQLMHYCFLNSVSINDTELNCLAFLGELGKVRLTEFSQKGMERKILGSGNAMTNCVGHLADRGLIVKEGIGKKIVYLSPKMEVFSEGNIVMQIKLFKIESVKAARDLQKNVSKVELAL